MHGAKLITEYSVLQVTIFSSTPDSAVLRQPISCVAQNSGAAMAGTGSTPYWYGGQEVHLHGSKCTSHSSSDNRLTPRSEQIGELQGRYLHWFRLVSRLGRSVGPLLKLPAAVKQRDKPCLLKQSSNVLCEAVAVLD